MNDWHPRTTRIRMKPVFSKMLEIDVTKKDHLSPIKISPHSSISTKRPLWKFTPSTNIFRMLMLTIWYIFQIGDFMFFVHSIVWCWKEEFVTKHSLALWTFKNKGMKNWNRVKENILIGVKLIDSDSKVIAGPAVAMTSDHVTSWTPKKEKCKFAWIPGSKIISLKYCILH